MDYFLQHCSGIIEQQGNIFLSLFLGGLLGSLNHCVGMCSPFVLMQIASCNEQPTSFLQKIYGAALVAYHTGRITTYVMLAFVTSLFSLQIVGGVLGQFFIAVLLALAGILFIMNAIPSLSFFGHGVSLFDISGVFARLINPLLRSRHFISRYLLGIVLGFLPCGLVFAALMVTTSMNHAGTAALAMACFGLGTVPALVCVALFGQVIIKKWQNNFKKLSQIMLVLNGLFLLFMAFKKIMILL
jgi:hypothetical protein